MATSTSGRRGRPTLLPHGARGGRHHRSRVGRTRFTVGVAIAVATTLVAGVQVGNASGLRTPNGTCSLSWKGVPGCGVLWGTSDGDNSTSSTTSLESQINRKFAFVYHFHSIASALPTSGEKQLVSGGRYLHEDLEARGYTFSQIANGAVDSYLRAQATGFKSLGKPVYVTFQHEPDTKFEWGTHGTAAQFIAAWRHIHNVYAAIGATNVAFVWVVTGWKGNWWKEDQLWPGSSYVDWISWDPYNLANCQSGTIDLSQWIGFEQSFAQTYSWMRNGGDNHIIDGTKPFMFSEFGTVYDPAKPSLTANWYSAVASTLTRYPQVKAVTQFNVKRDCDFRINANSTVLSAYRTTGLNSYVNP